MPTIDEAAHLLATARKTGQPASFENIVLADASSAYAVQDKVAHAFDWFASGPAQHWKSGGPSRDAVLTHAPLPPAGVWASPAHARDWPFSLRGIEAEIALRLGRAVDATLAGSIDGTSAAEMVDAMCVSIEIVDSRWSDGLDAPAMAKLADLQSHGALVLGPWIPFAARDWRSQICRVQIGNREPVERTGSHPMQDPAFVLAAWLTHATRHGDTVPAGTVVTTGSWVGILHAAAGDLVTAEFAGIGQASVQL